MKRFSIAILLFFAVIIANTAKAQFGGGSTITGKISGTITDSITKKPVQYASVTIFHSGGTAPINGMLTDEKGTFKLFNLKPGSYKVIITFLKGYSGYKDKTIDPVITTLSKPDNNMGNILVTPDNRVLEEVKVTGTAALVENHIDKLVYNAEKDLTSAGGNALDILKKVPLVSVDINDNVAIRGDQNVKVLINGKPSGITSTSLSDALKSIPADQIKNIEVITSPSAKYDAEGSAGILNIVTKSKNVSGISGSVSGGVGTRQNNGNINFNYNKNRLSFSANLSGNLTWPQTSLTNFDQKITNGDTVKQTDYFAKSTVKRHALMGSATIGYDFNNYNNISSTFRINQGAFKINGTQYDTLKNNEILAENAIYTGTTASNNALTGFDWSADYTHKFKKEGHEINLSAQWSHSSINTDYLYNYTAVNPNQKGNDDGKNNEYTLQADYTLPVNKLLKIEAGGKSIFRRLSSDYNNFNGVVNQVDNSIDYVFDPVNSNIYNYNQDVYAGYSVLTFTLPKSYAVLVGARYENTNITGEPINALQTNLAPFSHSYNTFIPSITLQKQLDPSNTLKLSYSKRIQRPSLQFLNPFINRSTLQSQSVGNPNLNPEISQTIELNYNTFFGSSIVNVSVYHKHISSMIEGIAQPITYITGGDTIPATLTSYKNIGSNNSWGTSFYGSVSPIKILTIRASINAYTYNPDPSGLFVLQHTSTGTFIQYNAFLSGGVTLPSGFIAEMYAVENSSQHTIQGTNPGFGFYAIGLRKQFDNKKASIGLNTVSPFSKYKNFDQRISGPDFSQVRLTQFPFRSIGLTFSYSFGKTTFSNPNEKKKGVDNDDLKQGGGDTGMGGGGGSPGGRQ